MCSDFVSFVLSRFEMRLRVSPLSIDTRTTSCSIPMGKQELVDNVVVGPNKRQQPGPPISNFVISNSALHYCK